MNELLLDYLPLVIFIGVALVISLVLLLVPFVVAYKAPEPGTVVDAAAASPAQMSAPRQRQLLPRSARSVAVAIWWHFPASACRAPLRQSRTSMSLPKRPRWRAPSLASASSPTTTIRGTS